DGRTLTAKDLSGTLKKVGIADRKSKGFGGACRRRSTWMVGPPSAGLNCLLAIRASEMAASREGGDVLIAGVLSVRGESPAGGGKRKVDR
ncbi:MAG TPA: hypothetical protein PKX23_10070, partial [Verrucomicrobiota bacterium]|nr:hypothetical protein [Verrucomicrobiota bacterium]